MAQTPNELKYTKDHEWVKLNGNTATIGITDYAQEKLTDIVFVELPEIGKKVEAGKNLANIESVKSVSEIFVPLSGKVIEVNEKLSDSPEIINKDCYGDGWIAKIELSSEGGIDSLMSAEQYEKTLG